MADRTMSAEDLLAMGYTREDVEMMMEREAERAQEVRNVVAPAPAPAPAPSQQATGYGALNGPPPGFSAYDVPTTAPAPAAPRQQRASAVDIERSRIRAEEEALVLGFRQDEIHQMPDGLYMAGPNHQAYQAALRSNQIRQEQRNVVDARDARSTRDIAIETLARDGSNRGRAVVVTGRNATLLAREVSSATSVEILVTGVESGAQKRITVNITPGESVINTPVNGNRSPISRRARTRVSAEDRANVRPGVRERAQRAVSSVRTQETARGVVERAVSDGRAISAESLARELSR